MKTACRTPSLIGLFAKRVLLQYNYILHNSLNTVLGKTSVSMMVLLVVAASLIGINSIHQYVEGQTPKPQRTVQVAGRVLGAIISEDKTCTAFVEFLAINQIFSNLIPVPL